VFNVLLARVMFEKKVMTAYKGTLGFNDDMFSCNLIVLFDATKRRVHTPHTRMSYRTRISLM